MTTIDLDHIDLSLPPGATPGMQLLLYALEGSAWGRKANGFGWAWENAIAADLGGQQRALDLDAEGLRDVVDFDRELQDWRGSAAQAGDRECVEWADEVGSRAARTQTKVAEAYRKAYRGER